MDVSDADSGKTYQATVIVPETAEGLDRFFTFRDRASGTVFSLNDNGAIITEKLSRLLDAGPGDE
jgi:putative ABC transport system permease protein